jgi:hypothetical protein
MADKEPVADISVNVRCTIPNPTYFAFGTARSSSSRTYFAGIA